MCALRQLNLELLNLIRPMDVEPEEAIVVFLTAADRTEAGRLAEALVEKRLAACVQIVSDIESVYRWQGKVERQREALVIAKTLRSRFAALERAVRALHSYDTPEIIALPVLCGSVPYLEWLTASIREAE